MKNLELGFKLWDTFDIYIWERGRELIFTLDADIFTQPTASWKCQLSHVKIDAVTHAQVQIMAFYPLIIVFLLWKLLNIAPVVNALEFSWPLVVSFASHIHWNIWFQVKYELSHCRMHAIHPTWIRPHLSVITHLNISNNKLKQLDVCIPWTLRSLMHLDVSHNQLSKLLAPDNTEDIICDRLIRWWWWWGWWWWWWWDGVCDHSGGGDEDNYNDVFIMIIWCSGDDSVKQCDD